MNVVLHHASSEIPDTVSLASTDWSAFQLHTDASIRAVCRRVGSLRSELQLGTISQQEYTLRTSMLGWNFSPDCATLNEKYALRVASSVMFDWAHEYVHDGLADVEFGHAMKLLNRRWAYKTCIFITQLL